MDYEKICNFIKELRVEKKWSQEKLASLLYVNTSTINRWENGKRYPNLDDLYKLSGIFNISISELVAGEKISENNNSRIQDSVYKYIKNIIKQMSKFKFFLILFIILFVVVTIALFCIYFFENYKSIRVYNVSGSSENYTINNGILVLTKNKIYLQVGDIEPKPKEITLIILNNDENKIVYQGDYENNISDSYGYNAILSYNDFVNQKQNMIVKIENEEILLKFTEDFVNDKIINVKDENIGEKIQKNQDDLIIKDKFICDEHNYCYLEKNGSYITYNLGILNVSEKSNIIYTYDIINSFLYYSDFNTNKKCNLKIENENSIVPIEGDCDDAQNLFNQFKQNYLDVYINK